MRAGGGQQRSCEKAAGSAGRPGPLTENTESSDAGPTTVQPQQ